MTSWLNRVIISLPRNATASHTVNPASSTTVVSGVAFTPTAGRLLVAVFEGSVTSTGTSGGAGGTAPTGWTGGAALTGYNAVNNTGLYVAYKTAAGSDTITLQHNASDYPIAIAIYEFASGSTFVSSVAATSVALATANPNLTGLTGTNSVFAAIAGGYGSTAFSSPPSTAWTGTGSPTKDFDSYVVRGGTGPTDGWVLSIAYVDGFSGASWQPTGTLTAGNSGAPNKETLTWAVLPAAGGTGVTVLAVAGSAIGAAQAPSVSAGGNVTVQAAAAMASAVVAAPAVSAQSIVSGTGASAIAGVAAPTVSAQQNVTIIAVAASSVAGVVSPSVSTSGNPTIQAVAAGGIAGAGSPVVSTAGNVTIQALSASAIAGGTAPSVSAVMNVSVTAVAGMSIGGITTPNVTATTGSVTVLAVSASAFAAAGTTIVSNGIFPAGRRWSGYVNPNSLTGTITKTTNGSISGSQWTGNLT